VSRVQGPGSKRLLVSLHAVCVMAFASSASAQIPDEPIKWSLALPSATATATPGGTITLSLIATIEDGWHLYSTTVPSGGPIATVISVPAGQMFTLNGEINEPAPKSSFDANFNMSLDYHEGTARFGIPLKVSATARPGELAARVAVSFQTCNDRFCLPPKQVVTTVQLRIIQP
jgi:DsbC/DsbD-like thiol-disulfide interchange protein